MSDLIDRQAAIEYLMTNMCWYNEDGYEETEDEKRNAITDLINGVPPAQTERNVGTCDECIHKDRFDYEPPCKMCIRIASKGRDGDYFCKDGDDDET